MAMKGTTVLVVEDDEETLNVLSRTLAAGGYDVIWARNGADTLKVLTRHEGPIALMILDVVLPGMSAPEVVEKVRKKHPEAGAIYVSAYDDETVRSHGVDPDTMPFLPKPYEAEDLLDVVREELPEL
jgi:two-component system cell cycle sensor histidine kinase/response regulator CckA